MTNVSRRPAKSKKQSPGREGYPLSLAPLSFKTALKGMLEVPPPVREPKASTKKKAAKRKR